MAINIHSRQANSLTLFHCLCFYMKDVLDIEYIEFLLTLLKFLASLENVQLLQKKSHSLENMHGTITVNSIIADTLGTVIWCP